MLKLTTTLILAGVMMSSVNGVPHATTSSSCVTEWDTTTTITVTETIIDDYCVVTPVVTTEDCMEVQPTETDECDEEESTEPVLGASPTGISCTIGELRCLEDGYVIQQCAWGIGELPEWRTLANCAEMGLTCKSDVMTCH